MIDRDDEIRRLHALGMSWMQIGQRVHATRQTVARAAARMGLPMNQVNGWSQAEMDTLKPMWLAGRSASEIAAVMPGRSRNAVIGIVHRMGLQRSGAVVQRVKLEPTMLRPARAPRVARAKHTPPKPGQQNRPAVTFGKATTLNPVETEKQRQRCRSYGHETVARVANGADVESLNARPWMERKPGECKFPLGERGAILSCCNPVERGGYCAGHAAVAYVESTGGIKPYHARQLTKHDRVEPYVRRPTARPTTIWDEARAA